MSKKEDVGLPEIVKKTSTGLDGKKKRFSMNIGGKLILAFLLVGLIPFTIVAIMSLISGSRSLSEQAFNQLRGVREIKKTQIEQFFKEREGDTGVLVDIVSTLRQEAFNKLIAVREVKQAAVKRYFQSINDQIITFTENRMVIDAMREFSVAFKNQNTEANDLDRMRSELLTYYTGEFATEYRNQNEGKSPGAQNFFNQLDNESIILQHKYIRANPNPLGSKHLLDSANDNSTYSNLHEKVHPIIRNYLEKFGYYDIFLVDAKTGDIVYSVFKELDFSTSLISGPYAQTNFGKAFRKANATANKDEVVLVDYAQYTPSYEAPASFIASPIYDGNEKVGIAMFQMPIDRLNEIMAERAGLGDTGETYIVGQDLLMRSDSYLDPEHHSVSASFRNPDTGKVDTQAARNAVAGKTGAEVIIDYTGNPVLSAYTPIKFSGLTWGLLAEIDVAEAFCPKDNEGKYFFQKYIEKYGYYDLFLINPDGYCFYTVAKESDYQTNFITGKYSRTNLGKLVKQVLSSQQFGMVDFAPYAPSNDEPAAFIAQPVLSNGKPDIVVALQLSLGAINEIMQQRAGMGVTGETYLVGEDKLMRSDSFLDPENHSVIASFANPDKGRVDTIASREALAGKTGAKIVIDYNGNPVLSAYTPLEVAGSRWALLAEIDEAEAFASVKNLRWLIIILTVVCVAAIVTVSILFARSMSRPITVLVSAVKKIADGDFTEQVKIDREDEIGVLAKTFNHMVNDLRNVIITIKGNSATVASSSEELSSISTQMASGAEEIVTQITSVSSATEQMSTNINTMAAASEEMSVNATTVSSSAEQLSNNMNMVASAVEEMTASINDVAKNAKETSTVANDAANMANDATGTMDLLGEAAREIGNVTEVIKRIAEQTNLLALNATIEAASAGEAGKGFAVVANEIKELAKQSAQAAEDIANKIEGVQCNTTEAVKAIANVSKIIKSINESVSVINNAVEQQTKAANDISSNVSEANTGVGNIASSISEVASGANEVAKNASEAAVGANDVSSNVTGVNSAASDSSKSASEVNKSATDLAKVSGELQSAVARFIVEAA
ncbi:MAG: methyl-accepting chemotaxis protein [Candidatus Anammoxibacter sp.]